MYFVFFLWFSQFRTFEISKSQHFKQSKNQKFKNSKFIFFKNSTFQHFKISKVQNLKNYKFRNFELFQVYVFLRFWCVSLWNKYIPVFMTENRAKNTFSCIVAGTSYLSNWNLSSAYDHTSSLPEMAVYALSVVGTIRYFPPQKTSRYSTHHALVLSKLVL